MSNVLVVVEHQGGQLKKVSLPTITFGQQAKELLDGELIALVLGEDVEEIAAAVSKLEGVDRVLVDDSDMFANYLAEHYAPAIVAAAEEVEAEIVAAPSSSSGKDYMPRAAALLEAAQVSDAVEIFDGDEGITFKRPIWAGNILTSLTSESDVTCVTVRTSAFDVAKEGGDAAAVEEFDSDIEASDVAEFVSFDQVKSD
jgi:electron transfer flavoprotein alpha subunit